MKDIKVLLVPDVHGRSFWMESVKDTLENYPDARVVFLGDYLDPYNDELEEVSPMEAFVMFSEDIIPLKKKYGDRVTLLLGNHDLGYWELNICDCRHDRYRDKDIHALLKDNYALFRLADEETIAGKHFVFSHAGIKEEYAKICFEEVNEKNVVDLFNNAYLVDNYAVMDSLGIYSKYRGWGGPDYGSLVWSDLNEWMKDSKALPSAYGYQIFGHSRLVEKRTGKPFVTAYFAMLDCRATFYLDSNGVLRRWRDDEEMVVEF